MSPQRHVARAKEIVKCVDDKLDTLAGMDEHDLALVQIMVTTAQVHATLGSIR